MGGDERLAWEVVVSCGWMGGRREGKEKAVVNDPGGALPEECGMKGRLSSNWTLGKSARGCGIVGGGLVGRLMEAPGDVRTCAADVIVGEGTRAAPPVSRIRSDTSACTSTHPSH
jgi:hypothetical protein